MKCIVRLLTALFVMWAASGHAQTVFPISENDVDASGTVLMCPKSNIYAPCRDTGSLPLPVEFGGALNLFLPRHRAQEANADASGTAQANSLSTALMCPSRGSTYLPCADVGTLSLLVEVGRAPKLFAQVITPYRNGQRRLIVATLGGKTNLHRRFWPTHRSSLSWSCTGVRACRSSHYR
jgi:hypothetical protein